MPRTEREEVRAARPHRAGGHPLALAAAALLLAACDAERHRPEVIAAEPAAALHPVRIAAPPAAPRVVLEGPEGAAAVPCGTCHRTRPSDPAAAVAPDEFHEGLAYAHGAQACISCHDPADYDRLRLADGCALPFAVSMRLCRQCHGTQARDYDAGAHGGWTGHWDLRRGPRERLHCIHCHDPHAPAYPQMLPTFRPVDRFLDESHLGGGEHR
jgi:hypothetical protein